MSPKETPKVSTKQCACGAANLVKLESLNSKHCAECGTDIDWPLEKGQERLNGSHRAGRKTRPGSASGPLAENL